MTRARGPHLPIVLVVLLLLTSYGTYRKIVAKAPWPFVTWTMYRDKAAPAPVAPWRRWMLHHRDGRVSRWTLAEPFSFLASPYRLDALMDRDMTRAMMRLLRALQADGHDVVGLSYEKRTWRYRERSLDEHLTIDPSDRTYLVIDVEPAPAALAPETTGTLVANGGFEKKWGKKSGVPAGWQSATSWIGVGVAGDAGTTALLLAPPDGVAQALTQTLALPTDAAGKRVRVVALVRASGDGAAVQLGDARSPAAPGDGAWHRVEVAVPVPAGALEVTLTLHGARGDTYFDHVAATIAAP